MKKFTFCLLCTGLLFSFFKSYAQNVTLGIRGGISIPDLGTPSSNQNPLTTGYTSRVGPDAGIFAEFKFTNVFSLQPMIEYSAQGGQKDGMQAFVTPSSVASQYPAGQAPQYLYANFNNQARLNYLMIPVLAKFGWDIKSSPLRFYVDAGPFAGILVSAKQVTSGQSTVFFDQSRQQSVSEPAQSFDATTDIKSQLNTFNAGVEGNIGLSYHLGKGHVFVEGGANYGLINIQKNTDDGKNNTGAATVSIGYSYKFGK